jgi:hypothetical protein
MLTPCPAYRLPPCRRVLLSLGVLAVAFLGGTARVADAQATPGAVEGSTMSAADGAPIPFALVRLLPATPSSAGARTADSGAARAVQQAASNANGRFRFAGVAPGVYRLQLARIGYRPVLSPVLTVTGGETLRQDLRGATQAIELAAVTVRGTPSCLTGAQLADEPRLATLWAEAQKGVELRRAFDRQHRYTRVLRQDIELQPRFRKVTRQVRVDTAVSEPDSVPARERRLRAARQANGYATGNLIELPDERELLSDAFLAGHCLETTVAEAEGALGLRFRPVRGRREGVDIRGTIWVAADTYQMRRLEFEYVDAGDADPFARSRAEYADVAVGGSALRLRTTGDGAILRIRGPMRAGVKRASATFTFTYQDVRPVGAR